MTLLKYRSNDRSRAWISINRADGQSDWPSDRISVAKRAAMVPESDSHAMLRGYDDVVAAAPVTVPYVRRSEHGAAWFLGRALAMLLESSGLSKDSIDGLAVSSFTLHPDSAVSFTQYVGLSPCFLESIPTGGACGVIAMRRAARAVQSGDASIVACLAGDTANASSFRDLIASFSSFARDYVYPYGE